MTPVLVGVFELIFGVCFWYLAHREVKKRGLRYDEHLEGYNMPWQFYVFAVFGILIFMDGFSGLLQITVTALNRL